MFFWKFLLLFNGSYFIICRHPFQVCAADGNRQWKSGDGWASAGKQGVFCLNPSHVLLSLACSSWIFGQMSMEALCLCLRLCQCWCICLLLLSRSFLLLLHLFLRLLLWLRRRRRKRLREGRMLKALVEGGRETEVTLRRGKKKKMYKMYVMEFLLDSKVLVNTVPMNLPVIWKWAYFTWTTVSQNIKNAKKLNASTNSYFHLNRWPALGGEPPVSH